MNIKILIYPEDSEYEILCKDMYNTHFLDLFKNNYVKFREYSILKGLYGSKKYNMYLFSYNYIKEYHPDYLLELQFYNIMNNKAYCCIIL